MCGKQILRLRFMLMPLCVWSERCKFRTPHFDFDADFRGCFNNQMMAIPILVRGMLWGVKE